MDEADRMLSADFETEVHAFKKFSLKNKEFDYYFLPRLILRLNCFENIVET